MSHPRKRDDTRNHGAVVVIHKSGGGAVIFGKYALTAEANIVAARLRGFGCACHVESALPSDVAGLDRQTP